MKKMILLGLLLATSFGFSQTEKTSSLKVAESAPFEDDSNTYEVVALKTTPENQTGIVREGKRDLAFEIFDENQKRVFSELVDIDRKEKFIGQVFGGTIIKVITVNEVSREDREVSCYSFDLANRSVTKTPLFTAQVDRNEDLFFLSRKRQTSIAISEDSRYFAVATDDFNKNSNQYTVRVFDAQDLSLKFQKAYQDGGERYFEPNDIFITNDAEVFVVGKLFKEGRAEKKKKKANYDFMLNKVTEGENTQTLIGLENEFVQSLNLTDGGDKLNLYGFYSEDKVRRLKGSCKFVVDKQTLAVTGKQANPLPVSVFEDLYGNDRGKEKADSELSNFTLDHILTDSKGNVYLVAEEFYVTVVYSTYGMTTIPHYDDIILLKYNAQGELAWGRSIFKKDAFPSYNAFLKDDTLHILLNSGKSLTEKEDGRTKASKGFFESTALYDFEYSPDGEVSYNKIQDNKGNTKYFPANGTYENGTFLMMSGGGRERQFMMLR
ncbi:hypothetical protein [Leeuwenhoekiella nanhaiensis]|uniref:Uncharacterized protein n=1 Tax=Leeuwenhoekiella nanhaiensis TaxID=1655491 RepID=A0A2G1VWP2_9FLAO|nr:hypothetical protein [Leeuwenhoekiella nanhaiensis]PHQ31192.1 hypothetical protein CJ305_02950 [Leeuwenhoekiella nanhaiensis]